MSETPNKNKDAVKKAPFNVILLKNKKINGKEYKKEAVIASGECLNGVNVANIDIGFQLGEVKIVPKK